MFLLFLSLIAGPLGVEVSAVIPSWYAGVPAVVLTDTISGRSLPIFIGESEARSIELALAGQKFPRPLTHDLLRDILNAYKIRVVKVVVNDLRDGTYYARIYLKQKGKKKEIDSRPSDAIALALRTGAPIFVEEEVFKKAERTEKSKQPEEKKGERI